MQSIIFSASLLFALASAGRIPDYKWPGTTEIIVITIPASASVAFPTTFATSISTSRSHSEPESTSSSESSVATSSGSDSGSHNGSKPSSTSSKNGSSSDHSDPICPSLYTPQCCETDALGVVGVTCSAPSLDLTSQKALVKDCATTGKTAQCCIIPAAGEDVVCEDI